MVFPMRSASSSTNSSSVSLKGSGRGSRSAKQIVPYRPPSTVTVAPT